MTRLTSSILSAVLLFVANAVNAAGFFGAGGSLMTLDDGVDSFDPINLSIRGGFAFNEYIEVGGEYNFTIISDEQFDIDWDVDTRFIFVKLNLPLDNGGEVYFMIGQSDVEFSGSFMGASASLDDSGSGYGFGISLPAGGSAVYQIDYILYYDENEFDGIPVDTEVNGLNFSYVNYFY